MVWYIPDDCQIVRNDDSVLTDLRIFSQTLQKHPILHPETVTFHGTAGLEGTQPIHVLCPVVMFQVGLKTATCKFRKEPGPSAIRTRQRAKSHTLEKLMHPQESREGLLQMPKLLHNPHRAPQGSWAMHIPLSKSCVCRYY